MGELTPQPTGYERKHTATSPCSAHLSPAPRPLLSANVYLESQVNPWTWEQFIHLGSDFVVSLLSGRDLSSSFPLTVAGVVLCRRPFSSLHPMPWCFPLPIQPAELSGQVRLLRLSCCFSRCQKPSSPVLKCLVLSILLCFCKTRALQLKRRACGDRDLSTANLKVMLQLQPRGRSQHTHRCPSPRHFPVNFPTFLMPLEG